MSFINRAFAARVAGLFWARVVGALIVVVSAPILTRIYTPGDYGEWVVWFSFSFVFSSISSLGYAQSIVLPKAHRSGAILLLLSLIICVGVGGLAGMLHWLAPTFLLNRIGVPDTPFWGAGLAGMVSLIGVSECLGAWCIRRERFLGFAVMQGVTAAGIPLAQIACAYTIEIPTRALITGALLGQGGGAMGLALYILYGKYRPSWRQASLYKRLWVLAKRYNAYPFFIVPYKLVATLRERLIYFLLGMVNSSAAGFYGIAARMVNVPNNLVASSLKPVFYQIAATRSLDQLESEVLGLLKAAVRLVIPVWALFAISSQSLFSIVFGEQWRTAGLYAAILSFAAIPHILGNWMDRIFDVTGSQKLVFHLESLFSVLTMLVVAITIMLTDKLIYVVCAQATIFSVYCFVYLYKIFVVANYKIQGFFTILRNVLVGAGVWFTVIFGLSELLGFPGAILIGSAAVAISTIYVLRTEYSKFQRARLNGAQ